MKINDDITIADWELSETFMRASGPGGQHVNKVSSAVQLRFEAQRSPNLSSHVKSRLKRLAGRRWTKDGAIVITAEKHRSQAMNRELAEEKLIELIKQALHRPKFRVKTKPSKAARTKRMDTKTKRGEVKKLRAKIR